MTDCVYLRDPLPGKTTREGASLFGCHIHEICSKTHSETSEFPSCEDCHDHLASDSPAVASDFRDPLFVMTRDRRPTDALRDMLAERPAFLVCGGPSAKALPLKDLDQPGCWSLAVNNMAGYYKADAFVCADPPKKFHEGIWRDPNIMKFVPTVKLHRKRGRLRRKLADGTFISLKLGCENVTTVQQCPNVWGVGRRSWMRPDDSFFTHHEAAWGNQDKGVNRTGEKKTVCTMLMGLRILYYLGTEGLSWGKIINSLMIILWM